MGAWLWVCGIEPSGRSRRRRASRPPRSASPSPRRPHFTSWKNAGSTSTANVNDYLKSWKVPENDLTREQKVTLRRILSHSAGLTVHGFPGYEAGKPLPTLVQVLNGEKPANTEPIRVVTVPGAKWRYAGGGYVVMQQMLIDVLGEPFPETMQEAVLSQFDMNESAGLIAPARRLEAICGHGLLGPRQAGVRRISHLPGTGGRRFCGPRRGIWPASPSASRTRSRTSRTA